MAIRVKHTVLVQISADTDAKQKRYYPDSNTVIHDTFDKQANGELSIPAATTEQIPFGDVDDVRGIYIELTGDAVVRVNGGNDNIPMTLAPSGTKVQFFLEGNLSAVEVENQGASAITGSYVVWGDPTP